MSILFGMIYPKGRHSTSNDEDDVFEVKINDVWFAWTEDGSVYEHTGSTREREDGYEYRGQLDPSNKSKSDTSNTLVAFAASLNNLRNSTLNAISSVAGEF